VPNIFPLPKAFDIQQFILRYELDVDHHFVRQLKWIPGGGHSDQVTDESRLPAWIPKCMKVLRNRVLSAMKKVGRFEG
jgi:hypothetical protein